MSTLSFAHSIAYICEKVNRPLSVQAKKELYDVVEITAKNSEPTIRQLFDGLTALRMTISSQKMTASDLSTQMSFLVSLSKLPYMIPQGQLLNHDKKLNLIVRMLKDEIGERDSPPFNLIEEGYEGADPWKLGLCCLYLTRIVTNLTQEWDLYAKIAYNNIHNVYCGAIKSYGKWAITILLVLISKADLALFVSKVPKLSESNERVVEYVLHSTLSSLFDIMQRVDGKCCELKMYMALVAVEASQNLFCKEESIWGELSDSRQMDWVQQLAKITTKLATLYLENSDIWLLISRILQILMTLDGFRVLFLLPDTMISLLQLATDRLSRISARFERQTWLPFIFTFCLHALEKDSKKSRNLPRYEWIDTHSNDPIERLASLFMDTYTDRYDQWYEAICNTLSTAMEIYLN